MYQYLRFFNKDGQYTNFNYDSVNDKWTGRVDMHTISTGLVENYTLYLLEEVWDTTNNLKTWAYPHINAGATGFTAEFNIKEPVEEIFLYTFTQPTDNSIIELNKIYSLGFDLETGAYTTAGATYSYPEIKEMATVRSESMPIHLGFLPMEEKGYSSILYIKDTLGSIVAEIKIYGEGEEEDERLKNILSTLGSDLMPEDTAIFDSSDVNEEAIDWQLINRKRKELILENSNIFPYLGSYKALINIIKFYGYQNVRMKEYWKNIDVNSPNYLKYRQTDIIDIFSKNAKFSDTQLIPSKIYKKTSKFGLFYDINVVTGEYDEDGLPLTEEAFTFTPEEILIKIYALKKKLQNYYLPVNSRIIDIIGESIYFAQYKIQSITEQQRIDSISLGLKPKISVSPSRKGLVQDLRPLNYLGFPVGPDLNLGGYTNLWSYRIYIDSSISTTTGQQVQFITDFSIGVTASANLTYTFTKDPDTGQTLYTPKNIGDKISSLINDPSGKYISVNGSTGSSYVYDNFFAYTESNNEYIRVIQKVHSSIDQLIVYYNPTWIAPYNPPTIYPTPGTFSYINVSSGASGTFGASGAPMSYYSDTFLGYFDRLNIEVKNLNDDENIPVGYPIVLHNETFNITWDDARVSYNQLDSINSGTTGPYSNLLYSNFNNSYTISGWTSFYNFGASGATYVSVPINSASPNFPGNFPSQDKFSWINLGYYGYYEMQWIITGPSGFRYDSGQQSIQDFNNMSLILPTVGSYKVELYLWDLYNTRSVLIEEDYINVTLPSSDFIGWYQKRELDYNWETPKYPAQSDYKKETPPLGEPLSVPLTWDEYPSSWDLPFHPNEELGMSELNYNSLDSIEFYQNIYNPIDNPLVDRYPYTFDLIGPNATWNSSYHLWWDNTGTRVTEWKIKDINPLGATYGVLFMSRANNNFFLDGTLYGPGSTGYRLHYEEGPTGWTGSTATVVGHTGGDVMYVNSIRKVFMHDGNNYNLTTHELDAIKFPLVNFNTYSGRKTNTFTILDLLNNIDPDEHPVLSDFIYYYNEIYDTSYQLQPTLHAVSKNFEKRNRHRISMNDLNSYQQNNNIFTYDSGAYETVYFGYLGDIPTHFEIYDIPTSLSTSPYFYIEYSEGGTSMTTPYYIGSTTLSDLCNELNGPTAQAYTGIGDFTYNIVMGASGYTGGTGPTGPTEVKLQGIAKVFKNPQKINIVSSTNVHATTYGRSLIKNTTWDNLRVLKYSEVLPLLTVVNFTYDNSKMSGKRNPKWILSKEDDLDFENIYYNNKYFSYMFTEKGSYSVSLELEDTNGNTKTVSKKEIIKII
jgi:hypothetical protein